MNNLQRLPYKVGDRIVVKATHFDPAFRGMIGRITKINVTRQSVVIDKRYYFDFDEISLLPFDVEKEV